jgi:uncharacterized protein YnzC (UPF0291/DUF896 family)
MLLDLISITRKKKQVEFTDNEYTAIKVVSGEYLKTFKKNVNPDDDLAKCIEILESVHEKVKHK